MGDLKKKPKNYLVDVDGENFPSKQREDEISEQTIERLRAYMQKFYELQKAKNEKE